MINDIKIVNIQEWDLCSDRQNSQSFLSEDKNWLLKISTSSNGNNLDAVLKEKKISDNAVSLGIITPFVKDVVKTSDGRFGIIYQNIKEKKSISRAISGDYANAELYMKKFVDMGNKIHATKSDKNKYLSIEDRIKIELDKYDIYSPTEKKLMYKAMEQIEKKDTFLHIDYHLGNVLTTPNGEYVIDIGLMSYGNPIYDYAICYLFLNMSAIDEKTTVLFHMKATQVLHCWDLFVKHQFGITDMEKKKELEEKLLPIALMAFEAHITLIPRFDVHKEMRDMYFEKAFRKYMI